MMADLLFRIAVLNSETDGGVEIDPAIAAAVGSVDRDVSDEEREELREVLESGWLDE
jgi:hypothetical protein